MQLMLFTGIPASGKSLFYKQRFADTHVRINLDMLRTRHRESILYRACLEGKAQMVVDNTNLTRAARADYIRRARLNHFSIHGYFFDADVEEALRRNTTRTGMARVPEVAILTAAKTLETPSYDEGYDQLSVVRIEAGSFVVEEFACEIR
ncbi:AAA family ATPase [Verrucomicrobium sp. BvORR034]|uniref:AAA family ATPase n=1 Tax=Verrucomicrobium sp. BvORR034 TaxID=1396418 RepID=UPI0006788239|nr:AAA family ATPase [Verrucomicrobium sp. BvORR034]